MSLIFNCGFSRVTVKESFHKPGTTTKEKKKERKAKYQRNANVDSEHFKRNTKCNGLNVTPYNAEHEAVSLTVSRQNKGLLCTLRQCRKQP